MNKQQMIDALVNSSIDTALSDPGREWLKKIFAEGILGFNRKSQAELVQEMQFRGLMQFGEGDLVKADEVEEEEFDDDCDTNVLLRCALQVKRAELFEE